MGSFLRCVVPVAVFLMTSKPGSSSTGDLGFRGEPTAIEQFGTIRENLRQTHAAKDAAAYLRNAITFRDFLNGSPTSILQLMLAQLFAGENDEVLQSFEQYVRMGQSNEETLSSKQFDPLRAQPRYSALHVAMVANDI